LSQSGSAVAIRIGIEKPIPTTLGRCGYAVGEEQAEHVMEEIDPDADTEPDPGGKLNAESVRKTSAAEAPR